MTVHRTAPSGVSGKPDTKMFFLIHHAMRADARRLAAALAALQPGDTAQAGRLGEWYQAYSRAIHVHHTTEDTVIFPAVAGQAPREFEPITDQLESDHQRLDHLLEEIAAGFAALAQSAAVKAAVRADVTGLIQLLDGHCACEEEQVVPLIERVFSAAEYAAVDQRAARAHSLKEFLFVAPWIIGNAPEQQRKALVAAAPLPLRMVYRLGNHRYRRLASVVDPAAAGSGSGPVAGSPADGQGGAR